MSATWSTIGMTFVGMNPGFYCKAMTVNRKALELWSFENVSSVGLCSLDRNSKCTSYQFLGETSTAVSEWSLVCETTWIVGLITSLQMIGIVCGCFGSGYISDAYGRKPTFFAGLIVIVTFNLIGYFTKSVELYAILLFIIGLGSGALSTTMYILMIEFLPIKWRSIVTAVPSSSLSGAMFAFLCWQLQDWRKVHMVTAAVGAPMLLTYWFLPESVRWLVTKGKLSQAKTTVENIASFNCREKPDLSKLIQIASDTDRNKRNTFTELFKTAGIRKVSICLSFAWFSLGFGYYGMIFGVNSLNGNFYLNLLLMSLIDVPFSFSTGILINRFGRRKVCFVLISLSGFFAVGGGGLQYSGFLGNTNLTTVMALLAKLTCDCASVGITVFTLELYPTFVRASGYGFQNTIYRLASVVVPQVITLNVDLVGIFYFTYGILMVTSAIAIFFLPETAKTSLEDNISAPTESSGLE